MPQAAPIADISNGQALVTSSQEWIMQFASAVVLAAFATSMWIAGQHFIQREALKQSGTRSILAQPCGDRAMFADRINITDPRVRSCGWR